MGGARCVHPQATCIASSAMSSMSLLLAGLLYLGRFARGCSGGKVLVNNLSRKCVTEGRAGEPMGSVPTSCPDTAERRQPTRLQRQHKHPLMCTMMKRPCWAPGKHRNCIGNIAPAQRVRCSLRRQADPAKRDAVDAVHSDCTARAAAAHEHPHIPRRCRSVGKEQ